jgi:ribosome-binding factor A
MKFFRAERINSLIQEHLGALLIREIEIPDALITVTGIQTSKKLDRATAYISVIPSEKSENVLKILSRQAPRLQNLLLRKINIKPMPRIIFEIDAGAENAARVEKILLDTDNGEMAR